MDKDRLCALQFGDLESVHNLIDKGNVNTAVAGRPPLVIASDYGHIDVLEYLLDVGADVNQLDKHGLTALATAVYENHPRVVRILLNAGADKNIRTPTGSKLEEAAETEELREIILNHP